MTKRWMGVVGLVAIIACGGSVAFKDSSPEEPKATSDAGIVGTNDGSVPSSDAPPSTRDGSIDRDGSADAGCFPSSGELNDSLRACTTKDDCTSVTFQQDCCGTARATGVNVDKKNQAMACVGDRAKGFPSCQCASKGIFADDGTNSLFAPPTVISCNAGRCETSFKER